MTPELSSATVEPRPRRFTVEEHYRMAAAGILEEDDRVELLQGALLETAPIGSRHAACVIRLTRRESDPNLMSSC